MTKPSVSSPEDPRAITFLTLCTELTGTFDANESQFWIRLGVGTIKVPRFPEMVRLIVDEAERPYYRGTGLHPELLALVASRDEVRLGRSPACIDDETEQPLPNAVLWSALPDGKSLDPATQVTLAVWLEDEFPKPAPRVRRSSAQPPL